MKKISACCIGLFVLFSAVCFAGEQPAAGSGTVKRAVSLRALQQKLIAFSSSVLPEGITRLGGLNTVDGYIIDPANKDIILAGKVIPGAPPLYLEDLVIALRSAWYEYAELRGRTRYYSNPGCSIDPNPSVIQELFAIGKNSRGDPSGNWDEYSAEWERIGKSPQNVRVLGIPFDTHFARVMVKADYDMKSLVNGSDSLDCPGFTSLMDMTMEKAKDSILKGERDQGPAYSLNRFWFYPGKNLYQEGGNSVMIEKCPVILLTEEQYLSKGKISGYGASSPLALKFTQSFTEKYGDISDRRPIYLELENLFRFVALAKVMKFMSAQEKSGMELKYLLKQYQVPKTPVERTLPGQTSIKKFEGRKEFQDSYQTYRFWLPSCGGVGIEIEISRSNFIKSAKIAAVPTSKTGIAGKTGVTAKAGKTDVTAKAGKTKAPVAAAAPGKIEQMKAAVLKTKPSTNALFWDF